MVGTIEELSSSEQEQRMIVMAEAIASEASTESGIRTVISSTAQKLRTTTDQVWYGFVFGRENGYFSVDDATSNVRANKKD